ncbi:MAG: NFACT RNA binding domain-containing protein [Oscillospiraceae bacterium]|nr:NFACT RNA binding domain-containing protein [Oscillospiraceae bacterium]
MATDACMLFALARELNDILADARVEKINMPARDEVLFSLRSREGRYKLLVSARPGSSRAHISEEEYENPASPPGFCMLLRKHLGSGRLTGFRTADGERVLFIDFDVTTESFERTRLSLSVELMGRYCNIVLIDASNTVVDALKRVTAEDSDKRQLFSGCEFTLPPPQNKLSFLSTPNAALIERTRALHKPLSQALLDTTAGLSPLLCRELACLTDEADPDADALSEAKTARLDAAMDGLKAAAENGEGLMPTIVYDGERAVEFSFVPLRQYAGCRLESCDTLSELYDKYYSERDRAERARSRSFDLSRQVTRLIERAGRKQRARLEEKDNSALAAEKQLFGELINANLHSLEKGAKNAEVLNYYTGETVRIPLDPTKTPAQNAQKYYKDYRKLTTAAKMLEKLLKEGEKELEYLETVRFEIGMARTEEDFAAIRKELSAAGYLKGGRKLKEQKTKRRVSDLLHYRASSGAAIMVGRNNAANDRLTLKTADKHDLWFHVKSLPGAHVILRCEGEEPDSKTLEEAAGLAALHSSADKGSLVAVDYTEARRVRKPAGARTGMVVYEGERTLFIKPDAEALEALKEK